MPKETLPFALGRLCRGLVAIACLQAQPALADATVTAVGSVFCNDRTRESDATLGHDPRPLVGARVELMDSDCDGSEICDDEMGRSYVQADGSFSVTGSAGDLFGGDPDVYLRFAFNDDSGVRLTDEADSTRSVSTDQHSHDNVSGGTIDFGSLLVSPNAAADEGTRCGTWAEAHQRYREFVAEVGQDPPAGHLDVLYWSAIWDGKAWTNTDTIHYPINYKSERIEHEFGHSIRHAADGNGAHFSYDLVRFQYGRSHQRCPEFTNAMPGESLESQRGYGFNEGWAHYWEGRHGFCSTAIGPEIEGNIAAVLHVMASGAGLTRADMAKILIAHPGAIHDLDEFTTFFNQRAAGMTSALSTVPAAREVDPPATSAKLDEAARVRAIDAELRRLDRRRADLNLQRTTVPNEPAPVPMAPCRPIDCDRLFAELVAPLLRRGEVGSLAAYRARVAAARRPQWAQAVVRQRDRGTLETWLGSYRAQTQRALRAPMTQALAAARTRLLAHRARFGSALAGYLAELDGAARRLAGGDAGPTAYFLDEISPRRAR